jgi:hypothetical protein
MLLLSLLHVLALLFMSLLLLRCPPSLTPPLA